MNIWLENEESLFGSLNEADNDQNAAPADNAGNDQGNADAGNTDQAANTDDTAANQGDQQQQDGPVDVSDTSEDEDDFSVDTTIDDDTSDEDQGGDDAGGDTGGGGDTKTSDGEPVKANTAIFDQLTAEEQAIKIKELKAMYRDLYNSVQDIQERLSEINNPDEASAEIISRCSMTLYSLKNYIADYMTTTFASKSYIENDIVFNRFLSILNSVTKVVEDIAKIQEKQIDKEEEKK